MLATLDLVTARAQKKIQAKNSNQASLLAIAPMEDTDIATGIGLDCEEASLAEMPDEEKLRAEKEALGFFLTSHPLQPYWREIRRQCLTTLEEALDMPPGTEIRSAILVTGIKEILTKAKNNRMAFASIEDLTGHAEVTFFPRSYATYRELLQSEQPLCLLARIDSQGEDTEEAAAEKHKSRELKLIAESLCTMEENCKQSTMPVCVQIPHKKLNRDDLMALRSILENHAGSVETLVQVQLDNHVCTLTLDPELHVSPGPLLDKALAAWAS
jgi:DNA polymerase-3 subunit alpha